jgi:hypothetical protein
LRFSGRSVSTDAARVRRAGVVLLLLTVHAVSAGATHFPRALQAAPEAPGHTLTVSENPEKTTATESGAHTQCLLCRLQRSLSTGLKNSAPVAFTPPHDSLLVESASADTPRAAQRAATRGRAPPRS